MWRVRAGGGIFFWATLLLSAVAPPGRAQAPKEAAPPAIEAFPDPARVSPTEVAYVHPLWRPLDVPPKLLERPAPADFTAQTTLLFTVHVLETGKVTEAGVVEPPIRRLAGAITFETSRWRFTPARKEGRVVSTWASYGLELAIELEKGSFASFSLGPVDREDPLPAVVKELPGDEWMRRYPREVGPPDASVVSVEDVDVLPTPEKTPWRFGSGHVVSRVRALVEVSAQGTVRRIVPTGAPYERFVMAWVRQMTPRWRLSPALVKGQPVESWMALDAQLEYDLASAKEKGKRSIKKNLRGAAAE